MSTAPPTCHQPYDFTGVVWAEQAPGRQAAADFLGSFSNCSVPCQDRCRDTAAADSAATTLVAFALISTSVSLQGDSELKQLIDVPSVVPPLVRSVFTTVAAEDFIAGRQTVTRGLADASVEQRSALIEWWANTAVAPPGALRAMIRAAGLG